ncbi:MAG TPA: hypothetical protein PLQ98_03410, partial [Bacillota bacterium]|nr:hypothetical protein [Bacillota bacterium]
LWKLTFNTFCLIHKSSFPYFPSAKKSYLTITLQRSGVFVDWSRKVARFHSPDPVGFGIRQS